MGRNEAGRHREHLLACAWCVQLLLSTNAGRSWAGGRLASLADSSTARPDSRDGPVLRCLLGQDLLDPAQREGWAAMSLALNSKVGIMAVFGPCLKVLLEGILPPEKRRKGWAHWG